MSRRAARVDANHTQIVKAFRDMGCSVASTAAIGNGFPDLVVSRRSNGPAWLVEVKDGSKPLSKQRLTEDQIKFHANWRGRIFVCRSIVEVPGIVREL